MNNNSEFMPVECLNVPKVLFYDKQYEDLSMDAKLIYALLLDRKDMAIRNEWEDEYGDTYVISPKQEMNSFEFYNLGIGDPIPVSAANHLGLGDLLDAVVAKFPDNSLQGDMDDDDEI